MATQPTILIADDDTSLLEAISLRLKHAGYRVLKSQDGYQAFAIARREQPDLLILDVSMPAGSGISVRERIQSSEEITDMPVIFITGHDSPMIHKQAERLGIEFVIPKPFDTEYLLRTVKVCLESPSKSQHPPEEDEPEMVYKIG